MTVEWGLMVLYLAKLRRFKTMKQVPEHEQMLEGAGIIPVSWSPSASLSCSLPEQVREKLPSRLLPSLFRQLCMTLRGMILSPGLREKVPEQREGKHGLVFFYFLHRQQHPGPITSVRRRSHV